MSFRSLPEILLSHGRYVFPHVLRLFWHIVLKHSAQGDEQGSVVNIHKCCLILSSYPVLLSLSLSLSLSLPPPLSLCLCFWLCREPMCWMLLGSVSSLDMFGADFCKKDSTGGV